MHRRLFVTAIIALAAAGSLTACGGDDGPSDTPTTPSTAVTTTDDSMTDDSMTDDSMTDDSMTDDSMTDG